MYINEMSVEELGRRLHELKPRIEAQRAKAEDLDRASMSESTTLCFLERHQGAIERELGKRKRGEL